MTKSQKRQKCVGCRDNFYNGFGAGTTECWSLTSAKVVKKICIPADQRPPYKIPCQSVLSCFSKPGYVFVRKDSLTKEGFWKS
jgi:hypothetical protein